MKKKRLIESSYSERYVLTKVTSATKKVKLPDRNDYSNKVLPKDVLQKYDKLKLERDKAVKKQCRYFIAYGSVVMWFDSNKIASYPDIDKDGNPVPLITKIKSLGSKVVNQPLIDNNLVIAGLASGDTIFIQTDITVTGMDKVNDVLIFDAESKYSGKFFLFLKFFIGLKFKKAVFLNLPDKYKGLIKKPIQFSDMMGGGLDPEDDLKDKIVDNDRIYFLVSVVDVNWLPKIKDKFSAFDYFQSVKDITAQKYINIAKKENEEQSKRERALLKSGKIKKSDLADINSATTPTDIKPSGLYVVSSTESGWMNIFYFIISDIKWNPNQDKFIPGVFHRIALHDGKDKCVGDGGAIWRKLVRVVNKQIALDGGKDKPRYNFSTPLSDESTTIKSVYTAKWDFKANLDWVSDNRSVISSPPTSISLSREISNIDDAQKTIDTKKVEISSDGMSIVLGSDVLMSFSGKIMKIAIAGSVKIVPYHDELVVYNELTKIFGRNDIKSFIIKVLLRLFSYNIIPTAILKGIDDIKYAYNNIVVKHIAANEKLQILLTAIRFVEESGNKSNMTPYFDSFLQQASNGDPDIRDFVASIPVVEKYQLTNSSYRTALINNKILSPLISKYQGKLGFDPRDLDFVRNKDYIGGAGGSAAGFNPERDKHNIPRYPHGVVDTEKKDEEKKFKPKKRQRIFG